jgi:hypothetical protein
VPLVAEGSVATRERACEGEKRAGPRHWCFDYTGSVFLLSLVQGFTLSLCVTRERAWLRVLRRPTARDRAWRRLGAAPRVAAGTRR